ncbi:hypothetical protein DPMN_145098 [Dreissena polymorpha]|uniref:Uncharacterized protein n=1 Tax=Dreissena polymorpha TaxID=45954 RepID=A0A9D4F5C8_DREPO|nr:hypothetical protein DPMN_145098 [Dreissena polymorpha]
MKTSTDQKRNGIHRTPWKQFDDLDFSDDLAFLPQCPKQTKENATMVYDNSARLSLTTNRVRQGVQNQSIQRHTAITVQGDALEEVDSFNYLGKFLKTRQRTDEDVRTHIGLARTAFHIRENT